MNDADHCLAKNCHQSGNGHGRASALVSPTKTVSRDVAPMADDIEPVVNLVRMSKWETKKMRNPWKSKFPESE